MTFGFTHPGAEGFAVTSGLRRLSRVAVVGVLAAGSACREVTVAAADVAVVEVSPPVATVELGATIRFTAVVRDESGRELGRAVTWSSNAPAILEVSPSGDALARATGDARITATSEGRTGAADVTVRPRPVASVEVIPATVSMQVEDTVPLQAVPRAADGSILTGRPPIWTTGNVNVAKVGADGRLIGTGAGATTATAEIDGVRGSASVSVRARVVLAVAAVRIEPSPVSVAAGDSVQLRAILTASDGTALNGRAVAWSSSAPSVAIVAADGRLRAVVPGTAVVTASAEGVSGTAAVIVTPVPVATVQVAPPNSTIFVNGTVQLAATLRSANGTVLTGRPVAWTSSNPQVASVTASGLVTGVIQGAVSITATAEGKSDSAAVIVANRAVAGVKIVPAAPVLLAGDTVTLQAVLTANDGSVLTGRLVVWTSSDTAVAAIVSGGPTAQAAKLTAKAGGTALITATSEGKTDTTTVTVTVLPVASVTVVPGAAVLSEGGVVQVAAEVRAANGALLTNRPVAWTSAAPGVATVSGTGPFQQTATVTAGACPVGQGTCKAAITATAEGIPGVLDIEVRKAVATLDVVPAVDTLVEGQAAVFAALVKAADGTVLADRPVTWAGSPAAALGIVPAGPFGQSAGVTAGNCPVGTTGCAASLTASSAGVGGAATITIVRKVTTVSITPAADTVPEGGQATFVAVAKAADGTTLPGRTATWSSAGAPVSITPSGPWDLTAHAQAGTCPAGTPGSCQAVLTATVDSVPGSALLRILSPVASVVVAPALDTIPEGGSGALAATPLTAAGDPIPDRLVTWSASDSAVAVPVAGGAFGHTGTVNAAANCPSGTSCGAKVTATSEGKQATAEIVVIRPVASITVKPAADTVFEGVVIPLTATVVTASNDTLKDRRVAWAAVSGPVTVQGVGTYQLSANATAGTCPQGSLSCPATLRAEVEGKVFIVSILIRKAVATVTVQLGQDSAFEGGGTQAVAVVSAADGTVLTDRVVAWTVTKPFAAIAATGPASANVASAACKVYDPANQADPDADEDCDTGVRATADGVPGQALLSILKPVAVLTVAPASMLVLQGSTGTLTAGLRAADGAPITKRGASVQWKLLAGASVTLSAPTGMSVVVTPVPQTIGQTTVEASMTENGIKKSNTSIVLVL